MSGVTLDSPVVWAGGSLLPVSPRTVNYPKEVVIGGLVPTDYNSNTKEAKQFVTDITRAFDMAAKSVNAAGLFPGGIQLRVEVLPIDPSGSGSTITVTEVASAFVRRGLATNANTINNNSRVNVLGFVGPYWSSNAILAAREVSTPFRLPVISYNAYTSMLDNSTEFPYFVRVNPANSDISKVFGVFLRSMGWTRIAVVTDDDASTSVRLNRLRLPHHPTPSHCSRDPTSLHTHQKCLVRNTCSLTHSPTHSLTLPTHHSAPLVRRTTPSSLAPLIGHGQGSSKRYERTRGNDSQSRRKDLMSWQHPPPRNPP